MFTTVEQKETPVDSGLENKKQGNVVEPAKQHRFCSGVYAEMVSHYFLFQVFFSEKAHINFLAPTMMQLYNIKTKLMLQLLENCT